MIKRKMLLKVLMAVWYILMIITEHTCKILPDAKSIRVQTSKIRGIITRSYQKDANGKGKLANSLKHVCKEAREVRKVTHLQE